MTYEEDFVTTESVTVQIAGKEFKLKEMLGEEYDQAQTEYLSFDENGKARIDFEARNKAWLRLCVVDAPYQVSDKKFVELSPEKKLEILQRLKPAIRLALINKIAAMNSASSEVKKK